MDPRISQLAHNLINYSTRLQKGERLLIDVIGSDAYPLAEAIIEEAYAAGGYPYLHIAEPTLSRALLMGASEAQLSFNAELLLKQMQGMDAYIAIRAGDNISENSDVPKENLALQSKIYAKVLDERVNNSKWVVLRYPNGAMAQLANKSTRAFEDFYFKVCNLDYSKMSTAMDALVARMNATDQVHIVGPGTDLRFSIKDIPAIKCAGEYNIPDGEVYTAPVKDSVNGTITYNTPSLYQGTVFENVSLTFKDGKIIKATGSDEEKLNAIFDTDDGARYVGELGIGVNPFITDPMKDILFDEKISGSIHFTPGACYEDAPNGNSSAIHWDLVLIQTEAYGGGEIYFDDALIRKNGRFVPEELQVLNPKNLI
ncbi:MAG: aminopeptidase [Peptococcaceae bacterium]|nr:aminopeptidase [Peptococcaceae bacterium]